MGTPTWRQRRAAARRTLDTLGSKDEMVDVLLQHGYAQDPMHAQQPLCPNTKRQRQARARLHAAWGITRFYQRRRA